MSDTAIRDAMSETMTPQEAARVLSEASRWESALVQRTEGVCWMLWGIASPLAFLTYAFVGAFAAQRGIDIGLWWSVLWVPPVAAGVLATIAIWRSAAVSVPRLADPAENRRGAWWSIGFSIAFFALFVLLDPNSAVIPLALVGGLWTLMGILNVWGASRFGRRITIANGVTLIVVAIALAFSPLDTGMTTVVSAVVSGVVPFSTGMYQTLRG